MQLGSSEESQSDGDALMATLPRRTADAAEDKPMLYGDLIAKCTTGYIYTPPSPDILS